MHAGPADLRGACQAILAPLRFACRGDLEHLQRVRGLAQTLSRAIGHALSLGPSPALAAILQALAAHVPADTAALDERRAALRECLRLAVAAGAASADAAAPVPVPVLVPVAGTASAPRRSALPASAAASATRTLPSSTAAPVKASSFPLPDTAPDDAAITTLRGVGPRWQMALAQRQIHTVADLLRFLPRRYQTEQACNDLGALQDGMVAVVEGEVTQVSQQVIRGRRRLEVVLTDDGGAVHLVWFRQPHRGFAEQFVQGRRLRAAGQVRRYRGRPQMIHPELQAFDAAAAGAGEDAITPVYLDVDGLHPRQLRRLIRVALPRAAALPEPLPAALRARRQLCGLAEALAGLHAPPATCDPAALHTMATPWHRRLIYEELLLLQLVVLQGKAASAGEAGHAVPLTQSLGELAVSMLPFALTAAQARVVDEVEADLRRPVPMQRLIQGDVGSGKTAVALIAAAAVGQAGLQAALMAPTELLAVQHAESARRLLGPLGLEVALLTGRLGAAARRGLLAQLRAGTIHLVVGTHAIIQDAVVFHALALGIVDEQHRFGVMQRARLRELGQASLGTSPHVLVMTATPIPRTLALTVYGDLDVSIIDALPPGRQPICTQLLAERQRAVAYKAVCAAVAAGQQAYVVFPLVEESDKEGMDRLRDATSSAVELQAGPLAGLRVGILHGRLTADEKEVVMRAFASRALDVLVATTIVEVGIDIPNATVMVIENAERFGLSQLHQLRGRVGRGQVASSCYLIAAFSANEDTWRRLQVMQETSDGFRVAEEDLAIRGPGDFMGTRQAGLPILLLADLVRDQALLQAARADAAALLAADPGLVQPEHAVLRACLDASSRRGLDLARIG